MLQDNVDNTKSCFPWDLYFFLAWNQSCRHIIASPPPSSLSPHRHHCQCNMCVHSLQTSLYLCLMSVSPAGKLNLFKAQFTQECNGENLPSAGLAFESTINITLFGIGFEPGAMDGSVFFRCALCHRPCCLCYGSNQKWYLLPCPCYLRSPPHQHHLTGWLQTCWP